MNKLKGSLGAIKMKYLMFVFAVAMLAALPTRVYQLLAIVDYNNGFYNGSDITVPVLYGAVFLFAIIFMVLSFLSKEVPSPKLPVGKNPVLGVASIIMIIGLGWDILSIERQVVPQVQGGFSFDMFKSLLASNLEQNGGIFLVLQFVFAIFAIFYFIIFAVSNLNGKASYKEYKLLALSPLCWAITMLISKLMTAVSFISVSELLFEIFMLVFAMLFFLTFARISSGVFTEDSMWGIYGYGFSAALFGGLVTVPRIVCVIVGLPAVEGHEFNFSHFAILMFVLSYIIASLGIGFKDGIVNIRTLAEVELPDDDDVVIKQRKATSVEEKEPEYELFESDEVVETVEEVFEEAQDDAEENNEEDEAFELVEFFAEESTEESVDEIEELPPFEEEVQGVFEEEVAISEETQEEIEEINELLEDVEIIEDAPEEVYEIEELPSFEEDVNNVNSEEVEEISEENVQEIQEIDEGSEEIEEASEVEESEEVIEELPFFDDPIEVEEEIQEITEESAETEDAPEEVEYTTEETESVEEIEEAQSEEATEDIDEAFEELEEATESEDEAEIEEAIEAVEEPVVEETPVAKPKKEKKDKKSLFGLRKAPVQEPEIAEDLKPISLADLKKKQNLE